MSLDSGAVAAAFRAALELHVLAVGVDAARDLLKVVARRGGEEEAPPPAAVVVHGRWADMDDE